MDGRSAGMKGYVMTRNWLTIAAVALCLSAGMAPAADDDQPQDDRRERVAHGGRGVMIERLRENLNKLELTPEQDKKVEAILADAAKQLIKLREDADGNIEGLREKAREVFLDTRDKVRAELTAEQQRKLVELMPGRLPPAPPPPTPDAKPPAPEPKAEPKATVGPGATAGATMSGDDMMGNQPPKTSTNVAPVQPEASSSPTPARKAAEPKLVIGQPAPKFSLQRLDSRAPATLNTFGGKPLVLVFGSFTSPTFRDKVAVFEAMKKTYKSKANIVFVYTREAYAANDWDVQRNLDDQIAIKQAATLEERVKMAKDTQDGLKITIEMLVDDVDDGVVTAYEAHPNGAVVIDANGKIFGKQKWADPHGLSALVDDALKIK